MMIVLLIKALVTTIVLFFAFYIGRCSATHDIYDVRIGNVIKCLTISYNGLITGIISV